MPEYTVTYSKNFEALNEIDAQVKALANIEGTQYNPDDFVVVEIPGPPPELKCSKCGCLEGDSAWGCLIDIGVMTADGEEGFANVIQLLCDGCFPEINQELIALGFKDHRHGGINFLEDEECCGGHQAYENCPTPSGYGRYYVGNPHLNLDPED